jgi:hypothetical protein
MPRAKRQLAMSKVECPICRKALASLQGIWHHVNAKHGHMRDWHPELTDSDARFELFSESYPWLWTESARVSVTPPHQRVGAASVVVARPTPPPAPDEIPHTCPACNGSGLVFIRPARLPETQG